MNHFISAGKWRQLQITLQEKATWPEYVICDSAMPDIEKLLTLNFQEKRIRKANLFLQCPDFLPSDSRQKHIFYKRSHKSNFYLLIGKSLCQLVLRCPGPRDRKYKQMSIWKIDLSIFLILLTSVEIISLPAINWICFCDCNLDSQHGRTLDGNHRIVTKGEGERACNKPAVFSFVN